MPDEPTTTGPVGSVGPVGPPARDNRAPDRAPNRAARKLVVGPKVSRTLDARDRKLKPNRVGRTARGLYPDVSRTKLATLTGRHVTSIANILSGKGRCTAQLAVEIAAAIGMPVETLVKDLDRQQALYLQQRISRIKNKAGN